jgi:endonuclease III
MQKPISARVRAKRSRPVHNAADFDLAILDDDSDLFRWFLLCYLLGKPIQSTVAVRTWQVFIDRKLDLPWTIAEMPDRSLVSVFHNGGYTRYQHVMTKALKICMRQLIDFYDGSLLLLIEQSENEEEASKRLQKLYGIGPKTAEIFLRETEEFFARRVE